MVMSLDSAGSLSDRSLTWASIEGTPNEGHYRVAALPADHALTDDVILRDECGRAFLLSQGNDQLTPIEDDIADALGMFFEPSQSCSWHTVSELRRIIYGVEEVAVAIH